jgi:hypothetical protein
MDCSLLAAGQKKRDSGETIVISSRYPAMTMEEV